MSDIIAILIIVAIVGAAAAKVVIEKKKGSKCVGCPLSGTIKSNCGCGS